MHKFESQLADYEAILNKWNQAMQIADSEVEYSIKRDSCILRFELTFEVAWKCLQTHVRNNGFDSSGPRQAFENAFLLGMIDDEILWDLILKNRNLAVHVYREEWADELYQKLPKFFEAFSKLLLALKP